jgi:hypothetical protein
MSSVRDDVSVAQEAGVNLPRIKKHRGGFRTYAARFSRVGKQHLFDQAVPLTPLHRYVHLLTAQSLLVDFHRATPIASHQYVEVQ